MKRELMSCVREAANGREIVRKGGMPADRRWWERAIAPPLSTRVKKTVPSGDKVAKVDKY